MCDADRIAAAGERARKAEDGRRKRILYGNSKAEHIRMYAVLLSECRQLLIVRAVCHTNAVERIVALWLAGTHTATSADTSVI